MQRSTSGLTQSTRWPKRLWMTMIESLRVMVIQMAMAALHLRFVTMPAFVYLVTHSISEAWPGVVNGASERLFVA